MLWINVLTQQHTFIDAFSVSNELYSQLHSVAIAERKNLSNFNLAIAKLAENVSLEDGKQLPSVKDLILSSTNWMDQDGIQATEVEEI